ncbi:MAG: SDR family oxidoreductase [Cenarchaeum sp. SB0665_bin_23]|nr:SDR family oxidoreductase [Cenarchaeum sp. SB0667_bin_13]MXY37288.1 SDR family oxidoreductase [Cenarchaeum sp. SB0664_bin_35]MXY61165.1 SDR family oxidoreductase [Cenarchaeum sp. SB0665_bin_23]MXZ93747.1 SDR family oxidoreductase [Cenarchaeum sp. SB0666_bin_15]MYB46346.1 SDR family oxidoreductase [Cenarchaeum sp. SB0662_bin_33]MYC78932.1 SDR family oxidoreductase [Cenarchaeum sp. SB0661_bin_35]MYD58616.1 SDR family oxidoreductase [Cenarchaeum sp. SB0678_bin_8]MYG32501.1 SDR family oxidore
MLSDKVAIVTGASSGIGRFTAKSLAKSGVRVVLAARRHNNLDELATEIKDVGGQALPFVADVAQRQSCEDLIQYTMEQWGRIDVLVNNAGLMPLSLVKNLHVDEWDRMVDVNIKGVLYCTAAALPHMLAAKSGHIVNVSSVAGRIVFPGGSVYCATKHALTAFSEGLRQELSTRENIRVTCIEPGAVATELTNTITDEALRKFVENTKKMEILQSQDIADAILYAVGTPNHVNVNEILIRPTAQER